MADGPNPPPRRVHGGRFGGTGQTNHSGYRNAPRFPLAWREERRNLPERKAPQGRAGRRRILASGRSLSQERRVASARPDLLGQRRVAVRIARALVGPRRRDGPPVEGEF